MCYSKFFESDPYPDDIFQLLVHTEGVWAKSARGGTGGSLEQLNPLTLRSAKRGLMILEIFYLQKHFPENISRRNVVQKPNKNSSSNDLLTFALFKSYFQKNESSRRHFVE